MAVIAGVHVAVGGVVVRTVIAPALVVGAQAKSSAPAGRSTGFDRTWRPPGPLECPNSGAGERRRRCVHRH
jgi:hypothetical protein